MEDDCRDAGRYDSREGGGRVAPGAATESNAGNGCRGKTASGDLQGRRKVRLQGRRR